jgi:enoyl-CoA hydratase
LLGRPKAIRYLYEGRLLDALQAQGWGLVDEVAEPQDLRRRVQEYAEDLAAKPAAALAAIRRTTTLGGGMSFEDGMAFELETATALADTAISNNGDTESASCTNSAGPALALCMRP